MTDDELAARRALGGAPLSEIMYEDDHDTPAKKERRTPLWRWFSVQIGHSDPARAAAAKHVRDRWNTAFISFAKIDRSLAKEDSPHLLGFRELLDEYRMLYGISDDDDNFARETGVGGKLLPFAPEKCEDCGREAIPGTGKCAKHGGQWISEKDRADISRRLHDRLLIMSESALQVLQDILDNEKSGHVRVQAAALVLDRAGFGANVNVTHSGTLAIDASDEAMDAIRGRLSQLALNLERRDELLSGMEDIVDAELVPAEAEVAEA